MSENKNRILIREFTKSKSQVYSKLDRLKKFGILKHSLTSTDIKENKELFLNENSNIFETLEFYGDSVLYERITRNLTITKRFCSPHLLSTIRSSTICNKTLSSVYESLELYKLSNCSFSPSFLDIKQKADIVESIIGEISQYLNSKSLLDHINKLCEDSLDDLISYISYAGEASYFYTIAHNMNESKKVNSKKKVDEKKDNVMKNDISLIVCFNCGEKGHFAKNCENEILSKGKEIKSVNTSSIGKFAPVRDSIKFDDEIKNEEEIKIEEEEEEIEMEEKIVLDRKENNKKEIESFDSFKFSDNFQKNYKLNQPFHFKNEFTFDEGIVNKFGTNEIKIDYDVIEQKLEAKNRKEKKKETKQKIKNSNQKINVMKVEEEKIIDFDDFLNEDEENVIYLPKIFRSDSKLKLEKTSNLHLDDFF
eukprot:gene6479-10484_t